MMADFVKDLARSVLEVEQILRAQGFLSGFVDEDWMRENSSAEEWRDYEAFRVEYAREVFCSTDPAAVLHSECGEYDWISKEFEHRIRRRSERFGETDKLFAAATTRPHIQLTAPQQRLSLVLERLTSADRALCAIRERTVALLRHEETVMESDALSFTRPLLLQETIDELTLNKACLGYVRQRLASPSTGERLVADAIPLAVIVPGIVSVRIHLEARLEKGNESIEGAIFPNVYVTALSPGANLPRIRDDGFVYFHWAFARQFNPYSRFQSRNDMIVCASAWAEMLASTMVQMLAKGWKLELDGCAATIETTHRH